MNIEQLAREAGARYELFGPGDATEGGMGFLGKHVERDGRLVETFPSLERFAAAVRREALEEAEKACEEMPDRPEFPDGWWPVAEACSDAIRALQVPPQS